MAYTASDIEAADFDPAESLAVSSAYWTAQDKLSKAYAAQSQAQAALNKAQSEKAAADSAVDAARTVYFTASAAIANMMQERLEGF